MEKQSVNKETDTSRSTGGGEAHVEASAAPIYVASRASLPERGAMWRRIRSEGFPITSTWIDEDGEGDTQDFEELWSRIENEIAASAALVLYAHTDDFPLKGALIEAGIALGLGKRVIVCLPNVDVAARSCRPIGSWIKHPMVSRIDDIGTAVALASKPITSDKGITTALKLSRKTRHLTAQAIATSIRSLQPTPCGEMESVKQKEK